MSTSISRHDPVDPVTPAARAQLLTVKDVINALRISRSSVYRLFDSGELPWIQIGSSRRVRPSRAARPQPVLHTLVPMCHMSNGRFVDDTCCIARHLGRVGN
ncbi:MAG: helix-turn-helix domain-containing protein [Mycobacterium sp.]|uniref:helix-turn-helix domain-containing protein n=1 Tax=Mycobacterium sp. TaxID=1785 RepID=UPI003F9CF75F